MPWNDQRGGGRGPWGQGPQGGGGGGGGGIQPPDLDEILKQIQARLKSIAPGGRGQGMLILIGLAAIAVLYLMFNSIYTVQATERGVVLRFGQYVDTISEGLHFRLPYPIETVEKVLMTRQQIDVGGTIASGARSSEESLILTGDENIVDINFTVFWRVIDPNKFLFQVENVQGTIKAVAESAMREAVGQTNILSILTEGRVKIQQQTRQNMQALLDTYGAGAEVMEVTLQRADPPKEVIEAFRDVQAAEADAERARNEAEKYQNSKVPEARGLAAQIIQQAEAYKAQVTAESEGEASRFNSIFEQYKGAPSVTRERMFLETMEKVLGPMNKIIIDNKGGAGAQPYLAIPPDLLRRPQTPAGTGQ